MTAYLITIIHNVSPSFVLRTVLLGAGDISMYSCLLLICVGWSHRHMPMVITRRVKHKRAICCFWSTFIRFSTKVDTAMFVINQVFNKKKTSYLKHDTPYKYRLHIKKRLYIYSTGSQHTCCSFPSCTKTPEGYWRRDVTRATDGGVMLSEWMRGLLFRCSFMYSTFF